MGGKRGVRPRECLNSCADYFSWCHQAGLLSAGELDALLERAGREPDEAAAVLARAIRLREAIYRIFLGLSKEHEPSLADLAILNEELSKSLNRLKVTPTKDGFAWSWTPGDKRLDQSIGPIADAAADLLVSGHVFDKIRQCEGENCGWLFIDSSKNHSRCWCDMGDCGNRAKVKRHRMKLKKRNRFKN